MNKLYIANSSTSNPPIYGELDTGILAINGSLGIGTTSPPRRLHVSDIMRLEPRSDYPSSPSDGDLCVVGEAEGRQLCCYLNGHWRQLD